MEGFYVGKEKVPQKEYKTIMTSNPSWDATKPASFGFQQLAKMGWKEGKGLGRKEDGDTEAIKIRKKVDSRGLGREEGVGSGSGGGEWSSVLFNFDQVLQRLNSSGAQVDESQKHVQKATKDSENQKSLPRRPIYKKMMTAKSVNKYSSEDLNAILGNIALKKATECAAEQKQSLEKPKQTPKEQAETAHDLDQEFGFQTHVSQVSISDYFKKKMESLNQNHSQSALNTNTEDDEEESCDNTDTKKEQEDVDSAEEELPAKKVIKSGENKGSKKQKTKKRKQQEEDNNKAVAKRQRSDAEALEEKSEKKQTQKKSQKKEGKKRNQS